MAGGRQASFAEREDGIEMVFLAMFEMSCMNCRASSHLGFQNNSNQYGPSSHALATRGMRECSNAR